MRQTLAYPTYADAPLHEHLRRHGRQKPNSIAIIWYGREITYGELDALSDSCAAVLHRHGIRKGDAVALFMQNCPQYMIAHFGIQKLGAIVSPCSPLFKARELAYQLADLGAKVIIAASNLISLVHSIRMETQVKTVLSVCYTDLLPDHPTYSLPVDLKETAPAEKSKDTDLLQAILLEDEAPPKPAIEMDDVALLVYTSGTTGRPKGAMLTFRNCMFKTAGLAKLAELTSSDVHLAIPPLYHISGMLYGMNMPILTGAPVVLHFRFHALSTLESIQTHKVTYWKAIAPMLVAAMDAGGEKVFDLSTLRVTSASSFGIRTTPELSEQWRKFTGCIATEAGYGLSETHTGDAVTLSSELRWGTNGKLMPGVQCRILDPSTGRELSPGEQGEIVLKSEGNFLGYWNQPDKTAETLREGWVHTGDIGKMDQDGYLTLLGRIKELIKVSGYSVFPEDVEALLREHPDIQQVAVTGFADPSKGEVVKAFIVLRPEGRGSTTADSLIAWSRENMSAYKVPRYVEFLDELPTTASGKVMRRLL